MTSPGYRIVDHDIIWSNAFAEEKARVVDLLGIGEMYVQHVGSTAVPGLAAKPIIDIMVGIPDMKYADDYTSRLERIGYEWRDDTVPGTRYIRKAAPRRFNLHLTEHCGTFWEELLPVISFL